MCGMVGAVAERDVLGVLVEGLRRLEYRGYDSAGLAMLDADSRMVCRKRSGKVEQLEQCLREQPPSGHIGIAHTRWATHGAPETRNAHPHTSGDAVAIVHNGIVENFRELRDMLSKEGYQAASDTDSEVIAHLVHWHLGQCSDADRMLDAVRRSVAMLEGSYGLLALSAEEPGALVAARQGSPVVIGVGASERYLASDAMALHQLTDRFVYLEDGDVACIRLREHRVWDREGQTVQRPVHRVEHAGAGADKGHYSHFAEKEIFEQPDTARSALAGRIGRHGVYPEAFGVEAAGVLERVRAVTIVACGTSYHAGMIARYWIESLARLPCQVEIASEHRYRESVMAEDGLVVSVSQSGETADTLGALRELRRRDGRVPTLAICNQAHSAIVRESDMVLLTNAGLEVSVASTKAFTAQLVSLMLLALVLGRTRGLDREREGRIVAGLTELPGPIGQVLDMSADLRDWARLLQRSVGVLFIGRGVYYPIALEGALKMKEISYVHAEGHPAGELKHGPLALVHQDQPVIAIVPDNPLLEKLNSNLEEVIARKGQLFLLAETPTAFSQRLGVRELAVPKTSEPLLAPIVHNVALQLLAYHLAVFKGTDIDQPRNLAKSVTVE